MQLRDCKESMKMIGKIGYREDADPVVSWSLSWEEANEGAMRVLYHALFSRQRKSYRTCVVL